MFWAGFGYNQRTELVALAGDPSAARRGVTSRIVAELYDRVLRGFVDPDRGDIFMHDNAPVHTAHIVQGLLTDRRIKVMEWPPYSPDLNPIENLWKLMKAEIYKLRPDLTDAPNNAATHTVLVNTAQEAWQGLREQVLCKLSDTMPNRVQAVLRAQGWYTKY